MQIPTLVSLFLLALPTSISAAALSLPNPIGDYEKLLKLCNDGGPNTYVAVRYADKSFATYAFNQCYPYETAAGDVAEEAVFCKSVTCYSNPNPDCTGGAVPPVGVPIPAGLVLLNVADFVQLLGQGATCQHNGLPL